MINVHAYVCRHECGLMCFQVLFGFLSRPKTRPYRVLCVLKNASKSRDISRKKRSRDARVLSVEPFLHVFALAQIKKSTE